jgi:quercetin dioxygenase-like cupin family protein
LHRKVHGGFGAGTSEKGSSEYLADVLCYNQPDRLTVLQEYMPSGSSEVRHLHRLAYQFFFILAGTATLEINGRHVQLHPFEGAAILPPTWRTR